MENFLIVDLKYFNVQCSQKKEDRVKLHKIG